MLYQGPALLQKRQEPTAIDYFPRDTRMEDNFQYTFI